MLGVVILNWNAGADTLACLQNVMAWKGIPTQIWVVDNASTNDEAVRIATQFPAVRVISSPVNHGFAGGNNLALRETLISACTEILLLNNDATIAAPHIERLLETLRQHPEIAILGPTLWDSERPGHLLSAGGNDIAYNLLSHVRVVPSPDQVRPVDYVPGTCVLLRTALLRTVGLLDENYFFSGEVADLCARARQQGFLCAVDGGARAYHRLSRSSELRDSLHIYYVLRNRFLYIRKFYPHARLRLFVFWLAQGVRLIAQALLKGKWRRARAISLGLLDGVRGRFGGQNARVLGVKAL